MPGQASDKLKLSDKAIMIRKQAPSNGSLPCFAEVTSPLFVSRGDQW
jgi:hypothetical protein